MLPQISQPKVRLINTNGGVNAQGKLELIPPLRESRDELYKSASPDRTSENLHENLLPNSRVSMNKTDRIMANFK